jgi:hypothetical protein
MERRPCETYQQPDQGVIPHHLFCLHLSRRLADGVTLNFHDERVVGPEYVRVASSSIPAGQGR